MLHPDFPVVEGRYQMTSNWAITLDQKHNRRIEDGSLVLWRRGFTMWIIVWNAKPDETLQERYQSIREGIAEDAEDIVEETSASSLRFSYRLAEGADDQRQPAFYGFAVSAEGHVQIAIYFDKPEDLETARSIFQSLEPT
jgi:hypothetical protein